MVERIPTTMRASCGPIPHPPTVSRQPPFPLIALRWACQSACRSSGPILRIALQSRLPSFLNGSAEASYPLRRETPHLSSASLGRALALDPWVSGAAVFLARFVAGIRTAAAWMAGSLEYGLAALPCPEPGCNLEHFSRLP